MKSERRCCCSITKSCLFAALESSLLFTISQNLLKLTSIESVMSSNHLIFCCLLLLLPSIFPRVRVFSNDLAFHLKWPKYWSFIFSISPSDEYSKLISFRIDWFDPAVQGIFKSLLQHHNLKASIFQCSALFKVQLTSVHEYWKTHSFDYTDIYWQSDVFAFNTPSRFFIAFLPRSKSFNFMAGVTIHSDFGTWENKICHCFVSPSICHEVMGTDAMILVFSMLSFKLAF